MTQVAAVMAGPAIISPRDMFAVSRVARAWPRSGRSQWMRSWNKKPLERDFWWRLLCLHRISSGGQDWLSAFADKIILPENQILGSRRHGLQLADS